MWANITFNDLIVSRMLNEQGDSGVRYLDCLFLDMKAGPNVVGHSCLICKLIQYSLNYLGKDVLTNESAVRYRL